ncbi:NACHT domain-containing protein [Chloroflexi bacterium TSY]|nr:NACHT domain-containing protein [Chloroflexi bacterium TSY]
MRALAETYGEMLRRHAQNPADCQHWHLLRLYARGEAGRGTSEATGGSLEALVTAPRTRGRARLTMPHREPDYLDEDERRVPVADRANFVGRRRVLQACLRALRADATQLGVLLWGMGGNGKSTLAHRLRQRWRQKSDQHRSIVLYGQLDEILLLNKLNNGLRSQRAREALNGRDNLRFRLLHALETCDEQLLLILDNFEDNFEQEERGQEHRLLITSRYRPTWSGASQLYIHQLDKLSDEAVQKKVARLTAPPPTCSQPAPQTDPDPGPLRQRAIEIADGNPRLLEWLFELLAQEQRHAPATAEVTDPTQSALPDLAQVLARMATKETDLRENILATELLAAQRPTLRQLLARGRTCRLRVPRILTPAGR